VLDTINRIALGMPQEDNYPRLDTLQAKDSRPIVEINLSEDGSAVKSLSIRTGGSFRVLQPNNMVRGPHCSISKMKKLPANIAGLIKGGTSLRPMTALSEGRTGKLMSAVSIFCETEGSEEIIRQELRERGLKSVLIEKAILLFSIKGVNTQSDSYLSTLNGAMNDAASSTAGGRAAETIKDFAGEEGPAASSLMKKVAFPYLGMVTMYSRNETSPSDSIYGRLGTDPIPMTEQTFERLSVATAALADPNRLYGKMAHAMGIAGEGNMLFLCCPFDQNGNLIEDIKGSIIGLFSGDGKIGGFEVDLSSIFEEDDEPLPSEDVSLTAEDVAAKAIDLYQRSIAAVRGAATDHPDASVRIELYSVAKKGGMLLPLVSQSLLLSEIAGKMETWRSASEGGPKELAGGSFSNRYANAFCVPMGFDHAWRVLNARWTRCAGVMSGKLDRGYLRSIKGRDPQTGKPKEGWNPVIRYAEMLDFALTGNTAAADRILSIIASHHIWLMIDMAHRRMLPDADPMYSGARRDFFRMPSIISLAVQAKGVPMSEVSSSPSYLFGVYCSVASELQIAYHEFNGNTVPESLVGYKIMSLLATGRTWEMLLDQISRLVNPYEQKAEFIRNRGEKAYPQHKAKEANNLQTKWNTFRKIARAMGPEIPYDRMMTITERAQAAMGFQIGYCKTNESETAE
jgi:hypothetical protein